MRIARVSLEADRDPFVIPCSIDSPATYRAQMFLRLVTYVTVTYIRYSGMFLWLDLSPCGVTDTHQLVTERAVAAKVCQRPRGKGVVWRGVADS